ncbi:putative polyol transporter 6 [Glycine soja]
MSAKDTNGQCQLPKEDGNGEKGDSQKLNKYACACVTAATIISAIFGYVTGVMAGALLFIKEELQISDLQVGLLAGILNVCALPACMVAGRTSDYLGRRYTIILASVIFLLGSLLMGYGPSYSILIIGRCIVGIGVGFALIIAPVYSAEISSPSYRGFLISLPDVSLNFGLLLGYVSNYFLGKLSLKLGWRTMLVVPAVPSLVLVILMFKLVESPRWLIMQGRVGEARKVLLLVSNTKEEAEKRLKEIKGAAGIDEKCTEDIVHVPKQIRSGAGALKELLCKPSLPVRNILVAAIGVHVFQQVCGIESILLYSPRVFEKTGIMDKSMLLLATVGMGISQAVFTFISAFLLDRVGRRILLLISAGGVVVTLLGLGFCMTMVENSKEKQLWAMGFTIVFTYIFVAFVAIGIGPVTWVYSSEIFPLRLRAQGLAIGVTVNRIANVVVVTSFISIYKKITLGGTFFMYVGITALAWWFYYSLPETKGRSLEDMETIFGKNSKSEIQVKPENKRALCQLSMENVMGVMAGALIFIKEDLQISDLQVQLLAGILDVFAVSGAMAAGRTSDYIGRRYTVILASLIFLLGSILMGYGPSYSILIIGRCIVGIGVGFALIIVPVYSTEISSPSKRGFLTSLPDLCINLGFLLGYVSNYLFEKLPLKLGWRIMVALPAIPSLILVILMLNSVPRETRSGAGALKELFCKPSPPVRRILIAAIGVHVFQQSSGIEGILVYSPRVFERTGISDKSKLMLVTVGMGISKTVSTLVATFLLDRVGRRILFLVSSGGMVVALLGLGVCMTTVESSTEKLLWTTSIAIIATYVYVAFMAIGIGPVTWVYSTEIFPLRLRAQGIGICVAVNRTTNLAVVTSFISIYKKITMGGIFFLFTAINALAWCFYYFLPETKGRSLEDMESIFGENSKSKRMPSMEIGGEKDQFNKYACACAVVASMISIIFGYDTGVMSGAMIFIKEELGISDTQQEVLAGILNLCALVGSLAAGRTSDYIGRRYTIALASVLFMGGSILMGYGPNYAILMLGRCVAGIGVGFALLIAPVYSAEISSAKSRGFLASLPELCIGIGILLGYVANYFLGKLTLKLGWRLMLGIAAVPSLALAFGILAMPESPRWLVMQGHLGKAKKVLLKVSNTEQEADLRFKDIKIAAGIDENCPEEMVKLPQKNHGEGVWKELIVRPSNSVRWMLIAAVGIHFFEHATGIEAVMLYSPRIFKKAGVTTKDKLLLTTIGVGLTKIFFLIIASFLLDRFGRRRLLLTSTGGMVCSLAVLGFSLTMVHTSQEKLSWALTLSIVATYSFVASFNIGLGPVTWVYSSEIFPSKLRAQGASIGVAVNRVMNAAVSMSFISIYKTITIGGTFFMFAAISILAWLFFYFFLPETKGVALEGMEMVFSKNYSRNVAAETDQRQNARLCPNINKEDGLETVLEIPIPEEMFSTMGNNVALRWQNMLTWMKAQTEDKLATPTVASRLNELRFLLYLVGCPLIPLQVQLGHSVHRPVRDCSIEASTAKYIVQQYIAATGGQPALNAVDSMCVTGQIKISASDFYHTGQSIEVKKTSEEMGGFVLWQKDPDLWCLEVVLSGCKVCCGSNGKVSWRHSSNQQTPVQRGAPRPLRRFLQGLDPRATANLFLDAACIGEKIINDEECFILKLETSPAIRDAQSGPNFEIIHHTIWGYFSQRSGLLVQFEDCRLHSMRTKDDNDIFWQTSLESVIEDYKYVDGINVSHSGKTRVTVSRYGEQSANHKKELEERWKIEEIEMKDEDGLPTTTAVTKKENLDSSLFGKGRYKFWALAAILLLAFWSMFTGTVSLRWSGTLNSLSNDIDTPIHDDLDVLEMEEREKVVRHMWDVYTNSRSVRLPRFWQEAFEAAYEDLTSDVAEVRDAAVAEIAKMSVRSIHFDPPPLQSTSAREFSKSLKQAEKGKDATTSRRA